MLRLFCPILLLTAGSLCAEEPTRLEVYPSKVELNSKRARIQLIVTGHFANGDTRDLTQVVECTSANTSVAKFEKAIAVPVRDGSTSFTVRAGNLQAVVPVEVRGQSQPDPVRFQAEAVAVLTKQGCNGGSCHGSPIGKGGFALSLFGYDPMIDEESLTRGGLGRRIDILSPDESLLLKKPLMRLAHIGGQKLTKGEMPYQILREWIAGGAKTDSSSPAIGIAIYPGPARVLHAPHLNQQLSVTARYADGTARDVTPICTYDVSHKDLISVDANGRVTGLKRGHAAVTVRYLEHLESVYFTIVEDDRNFRWTEEPEANFIDRFVNAKLKQLQIQPSRVCDDATFIRRLSLDLTGLLPTPERVKEFLADRDSAKRAKAIDTLVDTEEFARFWAQRSADLMRVSKMALKENRSELFANWIIDAYRSNMPFDRFARELLTSGGDTQEHPAANYFFGIPTREDLTETTAQLFMGSRINCAKCHNHPFEKWTQNDYYRIAAVFARVKNEGNEVLVSTAGEVKHPGNNRTMKPWGADEGKAETPADRRAVFAEWLTKPGNPFFARVEANRIWANLLGRGIVSPVDDFRSSNPPSNPELLDALAAEFERSKFDRKSLVRLICNSRAYQRSSAPTPSNADDESQFSRAIIRRLNAEQISDAVQAVTGSAPPIATVGSRLAELEVKLREASALLAKDQPKWEADMRAKVASEPLRMTVWHMVGPYPEVNPVTGHKTVYPPEKAIDFDRSAGGQHWRLRPDIEDGKRTVFADKPGVIYLHRLIHAKDAGKVAIAFEKPKSQVKIWLGGALVYETGGKNTRPIKGDQSVIPLDLKAGPNELLIKFSKPSGNQPFTFDVLHSGTGKTMKPEVAAALSELLAIPSDKLTAEQEAEIVRARQDGDRRIQTLRSQLKRVGERLDFATQRAVPEPSEFLNAFGAPKRESPCACERSAEPTVEQALQLLNGKNLGDSLDRSKATYGLLKDGELLDRLYLAALARLPRDEERKKVGDYLAKHPNRDEAVRDVVWAVLNTQEFLFQH